MIWQKCPSIPGFFLRNALRQPRPQNHFRLCSRWSHFDFIFNSVKEFLRASRNFGSHFTIWSPHLTHDASPFRPDDFEITFLQVGVREAGAICRRVGNFACGAPFALWNLIQQLVFHMASWPMASESIISWSQFSTILQEAFTTAWLEHFSLHFFFDGPFLLCRCFWDSCFTRLWFRDLNVPLPFWKKLTLFFGVTNRYVYFPCASAI